MNNLTMWLCKGDNLTRVLLEGSVRTSKRNSGKRTKIFLKIWNENGFTCAWLGLRFVVNGFYKILPPYLAVCKRTNEYNATRRWRMIFDKIFERAVSIFPCLLKFTLTFPSNYCTNLYFNDFTNTINVFILFLRVTVTLEIFYLIKDTTHVLIYNSHASIFSYNWQQTWNTWQISIIANKTNNVTLFYFLLNWLLFRVNKKDVF